MAKPFKYAGVVIEGTMQNADLIPRFLSVLEDVDEEIYDGVYDEWSDIIDAADWDCEEADELLEDLFDDLNAAAPGGYYFGTAEGDGACYGFWKDEEE